ncbi:MAG: ankyrin repeat domain-containing protein [bacterium]
MSNRPRSHPVLFLKFDVIVTAAVILSLAGASPLLADEIHDFARAGDLEQVKVLVEQAPALVNATNAEEETPLHLAAMSGNLELVEFLVANGAAVDARNNVNQSPLLYAAYTGDVKICRFLIEQGAEVDYRDARGNTPLDFAAREGGLDVVALLISNGAEIDRKGRDGRTPLWYAASRGHAEIVSLLVRDGADVRTTEDNGETALLAALSRGHADVAGWLVEHGALMGLGKAQLNPLLIQAASMGQKKMVADLVDQGADLTARGNLGRNVLHAAAIGGLNDLAAEAIDKGVPLNAADDTGRTPLHYAVSADNKTLVELLIRKGADVNIKADDGRTPLNVAEDWGRGAMVDLLIANGAHQAARETHKIERPGRKGRVDITYIANEGFLISDGEHKALIDALVKNPWGYESTSNEIFDMMVEGAHPFDGVDLDIASHAHADHYNAKMTFELLFKHPGVTFVSNKQSVDELKEAAGEQFPGLAARVIDINPDWGSTETYDAGGVNAEFFGVDHSGPGQPKTMTLATFLEVGGVRMVHLADEVAETSAEYIRTALGGKTIDIAFADPFFLADSTGQVLIEQTVKPAYIILMHLRETELGTYIDQFKDSSPRVLIYNEPMQRMIFEFTGNEN